jgi:hypothetical protein
MNGPLGAVAQIYAVRQIPCLAAEGDLIEGLFYELRAEDSGVVNLDARLRSSEGDFHSLPVALLEKNGNARRKSFRTYAQVQQPTGGDLSNPYPGLALSLYVRESDAPAEPAGVPRLYGPADLEDILQLGELTRALEARTIDLERLKSELASLGMFWGAHSATGWTDHGSTENSA